VLARRRRAVQRRVASRARGRRGAGPVGSRAIAIFALLCASALSFAADAGAAGCGDIDGDGAITLADVARVRGYLADPLGSALAPEELDRCRVTSKSNECDLTQLGPIWRAALIPEFEAHLEQVCLGGDADADGTPAIMDRCQEDPLGEGAVFGGCGPAGIFARAEAFAEDVVAEIEAMRALLAGVLTSAGAPSKDPLLAALETVEASVEDVATLAEGVADCELVPTQAEAAAESLATALALTDELLAGFDTSLAGEDWTPDDQEALELEAARSSLARAEVLASGLAEAYSDVCATATTIVGSGVVAAFDDANRIVELEDGRRFWLAEGAAVSGDVSIGAAVDYEGDSLTATASIAKVISGPIPSLIATDPECVFLRFAPVQPFFGSEASGPPVLHDPDGYRATTGTYLVEAGMRVAAIEQGCPVPEIDVSFRRQFIELRVNYTARQNGLPDSKVIANDLRGDDDPVPLPTHLMDLSQEVRLTATTWAKSCTLAFAPGGGFAQSCTNLGLVATRAYPMDVNQTGGRCLASYAGNRFDVDDQIPSDFRTTHVTGTTVLATWDAGAPPVFHAQAVGLCGTSPCSVPGAITGSEVFAIQNDDFVPIHMPITQLFKDFYPLLHGVTHAAGVRWPHVTGANGGLPFRYSCRVPDVTRDVVDFCPGEPESYFHLPFRLSTGAQIGGAYWSVTQGNMCANKSYSCPSHPNGFAIDMGRQLCGESIRAARAGRIARVRVGDCQNGGRCRCPQNDPNCPQPPGDLCNSPCCNSSSPERRGNAIWLRHQDGTYATYSHMRPGSIAVQEGDHVRRGQVLGQMGTTGNSSGVHLHWETKRAGPGPFDPTGLVSELGLFQNQTAELFLPSFTLKCYEPDVGSQLRSNNVPWP
jgi:hypothetical protein